MHPANVMIIDDDEVTLSMLEYIVGELVSGEILNFSSGIKAHAFLLSEDAQRINLVICDWQMPSVSGIKILETLKLKLPGCPFFMVTAKPTKELVLSAKRLGVDNFIAKPFIAENLSKELSILLEKICPAEKT